MKLNTKRICDLYKCKKVYGPYSGKDGRKRCVLYFKKGVTISKQLSRLLMEAKEKRILDDFEQVDHIDGDFTNDSSKNLQIITIKNHRVKSGREQSIRQIKKVDYICPNCGSSFKLKRYLSLDGNPHCCSRRCSSKYNGANQYKRFGVRFERDS